MSIRKDIAMPGWMRSVCNIALGVAASSVIAVATGCASSPPPSPSPGAASRARPADGPALDSLRVERGACYGICATYDVVIHRGGAVAVRAQAVRSRATLSPTAAAGYLDDAAAAGLASLPPVIDADSTLCPLRASDHSTFTLTAYAAARAWRVTHYAGCYAGYDLRVAPRLERLVVLEHRIDALAARYGPAGRENPLRQP